MKVFNNNNSRLKIIEDSTKSLKNLVNFDSIHQIDSRAKSSRAETPDSAVDVNSASADSPSSSSSTSEFHVDVGTSVASGAKSPVDDQGSI
jgi:hypothetical protein